MSDRTAAGGGGLDGGDPGYTLPRAREEYDRLGRQAAFLGSTTERLFRAAGIGPGLRVLDVGSGAGDVALLAAELVGPTGAVVGVEVDDAALTVARGRAAAQGLSNVSFVQGDLRTLGADGGVELGGGGFDAVVGRLVLMYVPDPGDVMRRLAATVRPGGVVAFQELDLDPAVTSYSWPDDTLWNQTGRLLVETFRRAGAHMRMGRRLFADIETAGLGPPDLLDEALTGGGARFAGYDWIAGLARALAPLMERLEVTDVAALELDTLAARIRQDAIERGAVMWLPSLVGAYAHRRVP
ncbi:class I SAM-dependent methyltransferase [Terrabacter sp. NPDC000476]|uniref:class I SAM-dependent methyltransferase n=1 Tax=Terrabacter sp. NPDC000476 TaxID=3154258 RepID=UPI00331CF966